MALAPIRGAPPGAPNPGFPLGEPASTSARPPAGPPSIDQSPIPPVRQRYTPIEVGGGGVTLTFRVIPEQPAISRASMTIHLFAVGSAWRRPDPYRLRMTQSGQCWQ